MALPVMLLLGLVSGMGLNQVAGGADPKEVQIRFAPYKPQSTFSVATNLIELVATVRDRAGKPVSGLQRSDFELLDNLKHQEIVSFSEEHKAGIALDGASGSSPSSAAVDRPRYIALFFDDTHSGLAGFARSKTAAYKLITESLLPGDRVGIFTGSGTVTLDFTSDTKVLLETLEKMRRHPDRTVDAGVGACPTLTAYQAYLIVNHLDQQALAVAAGDVRKCAPATTEDIAEMQARDAAASVWEQLRKQASNELNVLAIVVKHLAEAPGERMLLIVSPGFVTNGMERELASLTESLLRGHIVANALDDEGLAFAQEIPESLNDKRRAAWLNYTMPQRTLTITSFMADAAAATGGRFIHNNNDLIGGMRSLSTPAEVSYRMSFAESSEADGKYHKLKLTAKRTGFRVAARPGYFADSVPAENIQSRIDRVVASIDMLDQVRSAVGVAAALQKDGRYAIRVNITLDAKRLPFSVSNGKGLQQITFVTVLEDPAGNYIDGKQAVMDMAVTPATRAQMEAKGIKAETSFIVPKGVYRIREVIREAVHNSMAASTIAVPAP